MNKNAPEQLFPNYDGSNTVNLISSIQGFCGVEQTYKELDFLKSEELEKYDNVVLFLVDALGYNWLREFGSESFLYKNMLCDMTSVYPSTTATSVTTFVTGKTASEHAVMGWNMFIKKAGCIIQLLPWRNKILGTSLGDKLQLEQISADSNFYEGSNKEIFVVTHDKILNSKFNLHYNKGSKALSYSDLNSCFDSVYNAVTMNKKRKYIYAYWSYFDDYCHDFGIDSKEAINHFEDIDYQFEKLQENLKGTNTLIVVSADHGQINIPDENKIDLTFSHPELVDMLTIPMAGESRYQYCFVKDGLFDRFREYVETKLSDYVTIYSKDEIIESKLYGYGDNEQFKDRLGDFVLITKSNYAIFNTTLGEEMKKDRGFHGGVTDWETRVPVICIK
ncbi:MAG: alkaline phosphatase family protein [Candidatus Gracilibacteria bacterium]|nr:alkaline phosphatase family protein [Candidatus Gracilibacteria bacterium]